MENAGINTLMTLSSECSAKLVEIYKNKENILK